MQQATSQHPSHDQTGTISRIEDHGTIILVMLKVPGGWLVPVPFDHRCFQHLLDGESSDVGGLIGRRARYDGETFEFKD